MGAKLKDRTGQKYFRLTALRIVGRSSGKNAIWECLCDCGNITRVNGNDLGRNKSCGCWAAEITRKRSLKHGMEGTTEYRIYTGAKNRCRNKNCKDYFRYGGRGIEFRFSSFEQFFKELGFKPGPGYSVDRINNDGHYEPGNVRWATSKEQAANRIRGAAA